MKKTVLITGGTRGIGLGIASELAMNGYNLVINGVRPLESVQPVVDELSLQGAEVMYVRGDVSVEAERVNMLRAAIEKFGSLNVLINNAGIAPRERRDILDASEDIFEEVLAVNLKGPYFLTKLVAGYMVEKKKENPAFEGCIINVSSVSATVASVNRGEYCISKAGIAMATKLWAVRLGEFNIPVYEIQPGVIRTDMTAGVNEKYDQLLKGGLTIQKRWGVPGDVGKVAAAMVSGFLPYSTGQVVLVDGGMTINRL